MAWLTSITTGGTIVQSVKYITERLTIAVGTVSFWKRTRTVTVTQYPGLTQAAAEAKVLLDSVTTDCTDAHTEYTGGGSYMAVSTVDAVGAWERITPTPPP